MARPVKSTTIVQTVLSFDKTPKWFYAYNGWHLVKETRLLEISRVSDTGKRRDHRNQVIAFSICGHTCKQDIVTSAIPPEGVVCERCLMFYKGLRAGMNVNRKRNPKRFDALVKELLPSGEKPWFEE